MTENLALCERLLDGRCQVSDVQGSPAVTSVIPKVDETVLSSRRSFWLWIFATLALVLAATSQSLSLLPASPWYKVDLWVPGSLWPFSHNDTSRVAIETIWSVEQMGFHLFVPAHWQRDFNISSFSKITAIGSSIDLSPSAIFLLQDIQKSSEIFSYTGWVTVALILFSAGLSFIIGVYVACAKKAIGRDERPHPRSITMYPDGSIIAHLVPPFSWEAKLSRPVTTTAILASLVSLFGLGYYGITVETDTRALLPSLIGKIKFVCITHDPKLCSVSFKAAWGSVLFGSTILLQLLTVLTIFLTVDSKPRSAPVLIGHVHQTTLPAPHSDVLEPATAASTLEEGPPIALV